MKKRIIISMGFISVLICFGLFFSFYSSATDEAKYNYDIINKSAVITSVADENLSGVVFIPENLGGYKVGKIAAYAFSECENITAVYIPDSVKEIGTNAFESCISLENVVLSKSQTSIPDYCFKNCVNLKNVTIFNNVSAIAENCFSGCTDVSVNCFANSQAEKYAKSNKMQYTYFRYGDADLNGKIDENDITFIKNHIMNYDYSSKKSSQIIYDSADANTDGQINGKDIIRLKKYIANLNPDTGKSTVDLPYQKNAGENAGDSEIDFDDIN